MTGRDNRRARRLTLSREVVRELQEEQMEGALGGSLTDITFAANGPCGVLNSLRHQTACTSCP